MPSWEANRFSASQEILTFYATRRFMTALQLQLQLQLQDPAACSYPESDQSSPCPPSISWRFISILSSHPCLGLPSDFFPSRYSTKIMYAYPLTPDVPNISHSSSLDHPNNIWWGVQISKLLIIWSFPFPCYVVPLRPYYAPQLPTLRHLKPMFLNVSNEVSHL